MVEQPAGQLGLPGTRDTLAEQHLADQAEFADRLEAFQEAHLGVDVGLEAEAVAVRPEPFHGADTDGVDETGVGHAGAPCPAGRRPAAGRSTGRAPASTAAKAAMRVE
ncbi:hypothetical protein STREPTOSP366_04030 [Streptomyces variabilis]